MTGALRPGDIDGDIEPRRLGLKYTPPTLVVEFWIPQTSTLMHRLMELPNLSPDQDPAELEAKIRRKNRAYFTNIQPEQVKRLIVQLQERSVSVGRWGNTKDEVPQAYAEVPQAYALNIPEVSKLSGKYELLPDKNGDRPVWGSKNNRLYRTANRTWGITDDAEDIPKNLVLVRSRTKEADVKFPHVIPAWEFYDMQKRVWGPSKLTATPAERGTFLKIKNKIKRF